MNKINCLNPGAQREYLIILFQLASQNLGGVSHQTAFMGDCSSHVFSLMHLVDQFSLKEMRTWGQSKILEYGKWKLGRICM